LQSALPYHNTLALMTELFGKRRKVWSSRRRHRFLYLQEQGIVIAHPEQQYQVCPCPYRTDAHHPMSDICDVING
jgi:hypothetical protein